MKVRQDLDDIESDDEKDYSHAPVADPETWRVRLVEDRCTTCVFRAGNLMNLSPGRVKQMLEDCQKNQGHIVCHQTLEGYGKGLPGGICRGFEQHPQAVDSAAIRYLRETGRVTLVNTETGELTDMDYRLWKKGQQETDE
ncbi:hypothetical protein [Streptomyces sp. UNOC14_S4]|uniref:hypothetical protein n=1 Tax=Streptomyces sp. UNOC14_S4 TaxID=2872340 RepID=UPI001E379F91|nr:hypothetical protein [Streptomyces sp. UNOC14_S4]MCC3766487.1 hypothetical protein [Streptomyces sp. UNOC14_S4]